MCVVLSIVLVVAIRATVRVLPYVLAAALPTERANRVIEMKKAERWGSGGNT